MAEGVATRGTTARRWDAPFALVGAYLALLVLAAVLLPCPNPETHGMRLALCLLAVEAAGLAVVVPFLAARGCAESGWRARWAVVALPALAMGLGSLVAIAAAVRGAVGLAAIAWAQVFLLSFGVLLAAATGALWRAGLRAATAQAAATALGTLMLGQVFLANGPIEAAGASTRIFAVNAVLWTNPWLLAGGSILQADPLRSEHLYEWSVIVYYGFRYPASGFSAAWARALALAGVYAACAALLAAIGWACGRRRGPGSVRSVDN